MKNPQALRLTREQATTRLVAVIKRLHKFVEDANSLEWERFRELHNFHVIVIIPSEETASEPIVTTQFTPREPAARPPIDGTYRVGILKRRLIGHPFNNFLTVGRAAHNDVVLRDIEVSKVHALFEEGPDGVWTVRDNNSTNGTFLNTVRIDPEVKTRLKSADVLKIGPGLSAAFFGPAGFYQFLRSPGVRDAFR